MKLATCFLIFVLLFIPFQSASAQGQAQTVITLTANQVDSADDIEAAIIRATAHGAHPGTVILDGRNGHFVFTGDDQSLNIFVSNLVLRGLNGAVIENCDDGLFFDDFPLRYIIIEAISFLCKANGVVASGSFQNVTLHNNLFQAGNRGITTGGHSSRWLISGNLIQAGEDGIWMAEADGVVITNNHLSGNIGIALWQCSHFQVLRNAIQATYQGVLLGQESWKNLVQANTILGVSAAGIALEPGVKINRILENRVICAPGTRCQTVDASPDVREMNTIVGNLP
jgi:nitrous oxidase accessory protein NosD